MPVEKFETKETGKVVLQVDDLRTHLHTRRGILKAVDGVSLEAREGEVLGLVGESGSGKTMTCLSIIRLVPQPAARIVGGTVLLEGEDLLRKTEAQMREIRGSRVCMIMQDPMTSLNPVLTVGYQVAETLRVHQRLRRHQIWEKVENALRLVRIDAPEERMHQYPHQMSGGMRQRVVGAIALACQPRLLMADEPTTSLDPPVQAQYLRLLKEIQEASNLAMLFVTHNFGIVARICDRVAVMYAGRIIESAGVRDLFSNPAHPYTVALLNSLPRLSNKVEELPCVEGQPPSLVDLPSGCRFAPRCNKRLEHCLEQYPASVSVAPGHTVSCWLAD